MIAFLHDMPFIHHNDAVARSNAAQPMGHDHDAQPLSLRFVLSPNHLHRLLNDFLALRVQRARRFVQHQNSRVSNQRARNRDSLFLSSGQRTSQLAHKGVVAFRERSNERVGLHQLRRFHHFLFGASLASIQQILANGATKQHRLLRHVADLVSNPRRRQRRHIDSVPSDRSRRRRVQTHQQLQNCALAAATFAHNSNQFVLADGEVEMLQHLRVARSVLEVHVLVHNVSLAALRAFPSGSERVHGVFVLDHLEEVRCRHSRLGEIDQ